MGKISVALCTYNGEKYIREQLVSILSQTYPVDEIVIADDGSSDHTVEICAKVLGNSGISYQILINEINLGYRKNFEKAIRHTSGDIVFLSDQDDVWIDNKVACMVRVLEQRTDILLTFSDAYLTDKNLDKKGTLWEAALYNQCKPNYDDFWTLLLKGYFVTGATICMRRELFEYAAPFSEIWQHDGWLAIIAVIYGNIMEVSEKLILYRQHGENQIGASENRSLKEIIHTKYEVLKKGREGQIELHRSSYCRYKELLLRYGDQLSDERRNSLHEAIKVHRLLCQLEKESFWNSIRIIGFSYRQGYYEKYYRKSRSCMLADLLFLCRC